MPKSDKKYDCKNGVCKPKSSYKANYDVPVDMNAIYDHYVQAYYIVAAWDKGCVDKELNKLDYLYNKATSAYLKQDCKYNKTLKKIAAYLEKLHHKYAQKYGPGPLYQNGAQNGRQPNGQYAVVQNAQYNAAQNANVNNRYAAVRNGHNHTGPQGAQGPQYAQHYNKRYKYPDNYGCNDYIKRNNHYVITLVPKSQHPNGNLIDSDVGFSVNGSAGGTIVLKRGETYTFEVRQPSCFGYNRPPNANGQAYVQMNTYRNGRLRNGYNNVPPQPIKPHPFYFTTSAVGKGAPKLPGTPDPVTDCKPFKVYVGKNFPSNLYFQCFTHQYMGGKIEVVG